MTRTADEQRLIDAILAPGGGTQVSGDSGSGKSVFLLWLIITLARWFRYPILLIDPKGDLAKAALRHLIKMGPSVRRRVRYVAPGNPDVPQRPLNPLRIDEVPGMTPYVRRARQSCKVGHTGHIVLASAGDEDFDQKPLLFKWCTRLLNVTAELWMAMVEVLNFLNTKSENFHLFTSAVSEELARAEIEELASMRPEERERLIASTKNRFLNLFDNPIVQTHFGVPEVPTFRESLEEGHIVLVDLEAAGNLRDEDVTFFANAWLNEAFHTVFNMPERDRVPFFVIADEFPRLKASFPLIATALRIIRGLKTRLIAAHQGVYSFPDGPEDLLLQTIMGQCGSHVEFRHHNEAEARFFGRQLALPNYDARKVKYEHWDQEQYQDGNEIWTLMNATFNEAYGGASSDSEESGDSFTANWSQGGSLAQTHTDTASASATETDTASHTDQQQDGVSGGDTVSTQETQSPEQLRIAYGDSHNAAWNRIRGTSDGASHAAGRENGLSSANGQQITGSASGGGSVARNRMRSRNRQMSWQQSNSITLSQTLVPVLRWREVLRMIEFYTYDEQVTEIARQIAVQPTGHAFLYESPGLIEQVYVPMPQDPFRGTPRSAVRRIGEFHRQLRNLPGYLHYSEILAYREQLLRELRRRFGGDDVSDDTGNDPFPQ